MLMRGAAELIFIGYMSEASDKDKYLFSDLLTRYAVQSKDNLALGKIAQLVNMPLVSNGLRQVRLADH
jgi:hypothetical protein